jgi:hypothetical protein
MEEMIMGLFFKTVAFPNSSEQSIDFGVAEILAVHTTMEYPTDETEENKKYRTLMEGSIVTP